VAGVTGSVLRSLRGVVLVLATGYTLFFYSETVFWSDPRRVPPGEVVVTWLAYSLLALGQPCRRALLHL